MPSREDIARLSSKLIARLRGELHEDESSQNDEQLREGIGRLRHKNDEIVAVHDAAIRAPLESQLTAEREKVEKLRKAIEVGKKAIDPEGYPRTWEILTQALADTENK